MNVIFEVVPLVVNTIWDLISGKQFDINKFLKNLSSAILRIVVSCIIDRNSQKRLNSIKKQTHGRKNIYKAKKMQLKAEYKVLGTKISTTLDIAEAIVEIVYSFVF